MTRPASHPHCDHASTPRPGGQSRRGRKTTLLVVALVLAALGSATLLNWPAVVEGYSILALRAGFWGGRQRAAVRLARLGSVRAVPVLLDVSEIPDVSPAVVRESDIPFPFDNDFRLAALWEILLYHPAEALPLLREAVDGGDLRDRRSVALALGSGFAVGNQHHYRPDGTLCSEDEAFLRLKAEPALKALAIRLAAEKDAETAASMMRVLALLDPPEIQALIRAVGHADDSVRSLAVSFLGHQGANSADALSALVKILRDSREDPALREEAAHSIGSRGVASEEVIAALREAEQNPEPSVRGAARHAIESLGLASRPTPRPLAGEGPEDQGESGEVRRD